MLEIIISSVNEVTRTVAVEPINANGTATTIADVCAMPAVVDFFDMEPAEIKEALTEVSGNEVPDAFRAAILGSAAENGAVLAFDIEVEPEEDETEGEEQDVCTAGTPGTCTILTSGGLQSTNIQIVNGVTSVHDAIYNDAVRTRSGMTDAQLSNCNVTINDVPVDPGQLNVHKVVNGDVVKLDIRVAHTKGRR